MLFISVRPSLRSRAKATARFSLSLLALLAMPSIVYSASTLQQTIRVEDVSIDIIPKSGPGLDSGSIARSHESDSDLEDRCELDSARGDRNGSAREHGIDAKSASPLPFGAGFEWSLQLENNAVYTDLSMSDATHGFASAELGRVFRTTDGSTWTQVMNIGFPHYWYGVHAFDPSTVFISGFQNQTGDGIGRWSSDGGATWTDDIIIDPDNWLTITQFADRDHGIATAIGSGFTYFTQNGGATASDWTRVLADQTQGWFAGNFTFREDLRVYVTGISFCTSANGGMSYTRRSSIDPVFDGGVSFPDAMHGWTGGGQISAPVQGWVHRTTDGGMTWSGRILNPPYPIRSLMFLDENLGFAVGGNYFGAVGGIWSTTNGGTSWNLDENTGCEMKGIDWARVDADSVAICCAGSRSGVGRIYRTTVYFPETPSAVAETDPTRPSTLTAAPNPFHGSTEIRLDPSLAGTAKAGTASAATIQIVDASGRCLRRLAMPIGASGSVVWDGRDETGAELGSGVYFATIRGARSHPLVRIR